MEEADKPKHTPNYQPQTIIQVIDKDVVFFVELSRETASRNKRRYRMKTFKNHRRTGVLVGISVWQARDCYPEQSK